MTVRSLSAAALHDRRDRRAPFAPRSTRLGLDRRRLARGEEADLLPGSGRPAPQPILREVPRADQTQGWPEPCVAGEPTRPSEKDRKAWEKVLDNIANGDMPPSDQPQPSPDQAKTITRWVESQLSKTDCRGLTDPGRVTMRRLNRNEYNNTIRDLIGLNVHAADDFPSDDVGYGFDNIGDVLSLPPILLEKYLTAAEKIADRAIVVENGPDLGPIQHWDAKALRRRDRFRGDGPPAAPPAADGPRAGRLAQGRELSPAGQGVRPAGGRRAGEDGLQGRWQDAAEVRRDGDEGTPPAVYEAKVKLTRGRPQVRRGSSSTTSTTRRTPSPNARDRNLIVEAMEIQGPINPNPRPLPESSHAHPLPEADQGEQARGRPRHPGAVRRPRLPAARDFAEEVERLVTVRRPGRARRREVRARDPARGRGGAGVAPLPVPRREWTEAPRPPAASRFLNDYELASRLSYFLWSSMPDDELFELARQGKSQGRQGRLRGADAADAQGPEGEGVRPRTSRAQWLQTAQPGPGEPRPKRSFPTFDKPLRAAMRKETELLLRVDLAGRPQRPGLPGRQRLHVPERAAGEALRDRRGVG